MQSFRVWKLLLLPKLLAEGLTGSGLKVKEETLYITSQTSAGTLWGIFLPYRWQKNRFIPADSTSELFDFLLGGSGLSNPNGLIRTSRPNLGQKPKTPLNFF
jgi:hypothetical protein